jgi:hypothetical protein
MTKDTTLPSLGAADLSKVSGGYCFYAWDPECWKADGHPMGTFGKMASGANIHFPLGGPVIVAMPGAHVHTGGVVNPARVLNAVKVIARS